MKLLLSLFLAMLPAWCMSQSAIEKKFSYISPTDSLPVKIRSGKTMVILEVPGNNPKEWDRVSRSAHATMTKGGIDPVVYYDIDILFSGTDITRSFYEDLSRREIDNIVLIDYKAEKSRIAALPFSADFFQDTIQRAWFREGEFKNIADQLYVRTANSGLELSNLLLAELPEIGPLTTTITGRRAEFFNLSMSAGKMAVPKFKDPLKDQELQAALDLAFDYDFELVDPALSDEELDKMGFLFVLKSASGPVREVRKLLDYEEEEDVTGYVTIRYTGDQSQAVTLSLRDNIFKYYVYHIKSNTTYLGTEWDGDLGWRQALLNHLRSIKKWVN